MCVLWQGSRSAGGPQKKVQLLLCTCCEPFWNPRARETPKMYKGPAVGSEREREVKGGGPEGGSWRGCVVEEEEKEGGERAMCSRWQKT